MDTQQKVACTVDGFEKVEVTYNMLATWDQVMALRRLPTAENAKPVVVMVVGVAGDFWAGSQPVALQLWAAYAGWDQAMVDWVLRPNSPTA